MEFMEAFFLDGEDGVDGVVVMTGVVDRGLGAGTVAVGLSSSK